MVDKPISKQELLNAQKDSESLGKFINGGETETVQTRLDEEYPTLANAVYQIMAAGGFEPFATEADLKASVPTATKKAAKAMDTKKIWYWNGSTWVDTGLSELDQAKDYADEKTDFWQASDIKVQQFGVFSEFAAGFVGSNKKMPLGIKKDGTVVSEKMEAQQLAVEEFNANKFDAEQQTVAGMKMQALDPYSGYVFGIGNGAKYPVALRTDGTIEIAKLKVNEIELSSDYAPAERYSKVSQEWWVYPAHVYIEKPYPHVISGSYSETGEIIVSEYVVGKGVTKRILAHQTTTTIDDHNAPSVYVREGRRSIVMWQQHDRTKYLSAKVSTKDGDIATFEFASEQQILADGNNISYTQLHRIDSECTEAADVFWIFSRIAQLNWGIIKISVDQETGLISKFRIASAFNPSQPTNPIHYWEIDITTGDMTNLAGVTVGNVKAGLNMPRVIENETPLLAHKANYQRRLFYVRPLPMSPAISYLEWPKADTVNGAIYKVISLENGSWVTRDYGNAGAAFNSTYYAGAAFPDPCNKDELVVCRYDNTASQGVIERVIQLDGVAKTIETKRVNKNFLLRPMPIKNGGGICPCVQLYSYAKTSSFSFESDVIMTFLK